MFYELIAEASNQWWSEENCPCHSFLQYVLERGKLRDAQIDALRHYLYLKVVHDSKPLYQIFTEHEFGTLTDKEIGDSGCYSLLREPNTPLHNLAYYAKKLKEKGEPLPTAFKEVLSSHHQDMDAQETLKSIFYGIDYADYLFSLPMGAGKTFLMACFIYTDLYFSRLEPFNTAFAHNFLILIPSGLKSSILPSLKSIQEFDPSWILPPEVASDIKREVKFEVLDEKRSASKSNRIKNQNAQKINAHAPLNTLRGLVAVTNAEKLLDRIGEVDKAEESALLLSTEELEEVKVANELRHIIGEIPHLSLLIDEVHHASDGEIKLRQVVTHWAKNGNITNVLGFSGTPYLGKAEDIPLFQDKCIKVKTISNIVYHYPLIEGVGNFLKSPKIKFAKKGGLEIVTEGVQEFIHRYGATTYADGTQAKLAIYCGNIKTLEEEIYPCVAQLVTACGWNPAETILKYHRGNKEYPQPDEAEYHFSSLDTSFSPFRIVLLVQIGKEGWDCRSLTSVILPQRGACPQNMVLQTSCRCLREVDDASCETALIWLNSDNANTLNRQLKDQQRTDISELNAHETTPRFVTRPRYNRLKECHLTTPITYYQLRVNYLLEILSEELDTSGRLGDKELLLPSSQTLVTTQELSGRILEKHSTLAEAQEEETTYPITYRAWLATIHKESFGTLSLDTLRTYDQALRHIFEQITEVRADQRYLSPHFDQQAIRAEIRKAFIPKRTIKTEEEVVPEEASLLIVDHLTSPISVPERALYYPTVQEAESVIAFDRGEAPKVLRPKVQQMIKELSKDKSYTDTIEGLKNNPDSYDTLDNIGASCSYHYLPYHFDSRLEEQVFSQALLPLARQHQLEVYFNGDDLLTEFAINCYKRQGTKGWSYLGKYYPDFLMLQRTESGEIARLLIIETKGVAFAALFQDKKAFVEQYFLQLNNQEHSLPYEMDFLYLEEQKSMEQLEQLLTSKVNTFFQTK